MCNDTRLVYHCNQILYPFIASPQGRAPWDRGLAVQARDRSSGCPLHRECAMAETPCYDTRVGNSMRHTCSLIATSQAAAVCKREFGQPWIMVRPLAKSAMLEVYLRVSEEHAYKRVPGAHELALATPAWRSLHVLRWVTTARVTPPSLRRRWCA